MKLGKLYNDILNEEFEGGNLYGYHVTSANNLESINNNGFNVGHRSMQGKGVYAFYDIYDAKRYAHKGEVSNPVIVKFKITSTHSLMIINTEIAKEVYGPKYHLVDQINRKYWNGEKGMNGFLIGAKKVYKKEYTMDMLIEELNEIETNNTESNQRIFWSYMIPKTESDRLNLLHNGNYGIEYRINYTKLMYPMGYYALDSERKFSDYNEFEKNDEIPPGEEYDDLRRAKGDLDLHTLKVKLEAQQYKVRNNREYDLLSKLISQITDISGY